MKEVGPAVEKFLRQHKLWHGYQQHLLLEKWPELAGRHVAEVSRADRFDKGVMYVIVKDSVWAYHLNLMKPDFIYKLNSEAGGKLVRDIVFKIGETDQLKTTV